MKIPKRKCLSNNKVGKIFKSFINNKFDQEKEAESLKAFFQEDKPIKSYSDILIDEIKKPILPLAIKSNEEKRNIDVSILINHKLV